METSSVLSIKNRFTRHINKNSDKRRKNFYKDWYCGITNSQKTRNAQHKSERGLISDWFYLKASSMANANLVEVYFSIKGTANSPNKGGAIETSQFVYIFKLPKQKPQGLNGSLTIENYLDWLFS